GRNEAARSRLLRSDGTRLERPRKNHAPRNIGRWRQDVGRCATAGPGDADLPYPIPIPVEVGWQACGAAKPRDRRNGIRAANAQATDRRSRLEWSARIYLSLERHPK